MEEHHRELKGLATQLVDRIEAFAGATKVDKLPGKVEYTDRGPIWRPGLEGLAYLEAHLGSVPQLFGLWNEIEGLAGQYKTAAEGMVEGLVQQLKGYDDLLSDESEWRRGLRPSFFQKVNEMGLAIAKKAPFDHEIWIGDQGDWKMLLIGVAIMALSKSAAELEEWKHLFRSLVDYVAEKQVLLLQLRHKFHEEVKAFSSQMDPIIKAGFFEGTCPVCRRLR